MLALGWVFALPVSTASGSMMGKGTMMDAEQTRQMQEMPMQMDKMMKGAGAAEKK